MLKPTVGGIVLLQKKLKDLGFELPVFEIYIYGHSNFNIHLLRYLSKPGIKVDIGEMLALYGPHEEICDVRIISEDRKHKMEFSDPNNCKWFPQPRQQFCRIETTLHKELEGIGCDIQNIARYGKENPTRCERFLLRFFPRLYKFPSFKGL